MCVRLLPNLPAIVQPVHFITSLKDLYRPHPKQFGFPIAFCRWEEINSNHMTSIALR